MNQFRETTVNIMAILNYDELQTKVWHYKTAVYYQNTLTIKRLFDKYLAAINVYKNRLRFKCPVSLMRIVNTN